MILSRINPYLNHRRHQSSFFGIILAQTLPSRFPQPGVIVSTRKMDYSCSSLRCFLYVWIISTASVLLLSTTMGGVLGDNLALLTGTLKTYQKAACDEEYMTLRCPTGTTISVQLAQYGKTAPSPALCQQTSANNNHQDILDISDPYNNVTCQLPSAIQVEALEKSGLFGVLIMVYYCRRKHKKGQGKEQQRKPAIVGCSLSKIQREIIAYLKGEQSSIRRLLTWTTTLLAQLNATEAEYGVVSSLVQYERRSRSLMGPLPLTLQLPTQTTESIVNWGRNLRAQNGKRNDLAELYSRILADLELQDGERDLLYRRIQNARSKVYPLFKWRSEIIRQLRKFEKLPAKLLYKWARQGMEREIVIPDLIQIVEQMTKQNFPDGPNLVSLEEMRQELSTRPLSNLEPTREATYGALKLELKTLWEITEPVRLIKYILAKYSPETMGEEVSGTNLKQWYKKALMLFHPDKQTGRNIKWQILCEEITKCLTIQYAKLK